MFVHKALNGLIPSCISELLYQTGAFILNRAGGCSVADLPVVTEGESSGGAAAAAAAVSSAAAEEEEEEAQLLKQTGSSTALLHLCLFSWRLLHRPPTGERLKMQCPRSNPHTPSEEQRHRK
ncbi:unnamed protein product [Pleuronectes platessa]|uniref:Uncharacterized protein n=1 Tax=Pleuronectes platessa TaxID=8262 RepID=A0A9N7TKX6_PLEPL|nr:unnamed protein product [Pleuronectes platessa]